MSGVLAVMLSAAKRLSADRARSFAALSMTSLISKCLPVLYRLKATHEVAHQVQVRVRKQAWGPGCSLCEFSQDATW